MRSSLHQRLQHGIFKSLFDEAVLLQSNKDNTAPQDEDNDFRIEEQSDVSKQQQVSREAHLTHPWNTTSYRREQELKPIDFNFTMTKKT